MSKDQKFERLIASLYELRRIDCEAHPSSIATRHALCEVLNAFNEWEDEVPQESIRFCGSDMCPFEGELHESKESLAFVKNRSEENVE